MPHESTIFQIWNVVRYLTMFSCYFLHLFHIAFDIDKEDESIKDSLTIDKIIDWILLVDIILKFITAFQQDIEWKTSLPLIAWNYIRSGSLLFDLLATLPGLITNQSQKYFWFKLFRLYHIRDIFSQITVWFTMIFHKAGLNKSVIDKVSYVFMIIIVLFTAIHFFACLWIYIGRKIMEDIVASRDECAKD